MGIQHFHVHICLRLGIMLLLLAGIGSCKHKSSIFTEVENFSASRCFEKKYITETYFWKHDSFVDSDFQDFLVRELPLGLCDVLQDKPDLVPTLSVTRRRLIGEGSHRHLSSSIRFKIPDKSISELPSHFCEAIIVERLPSGVFADPFELHHFLKRGVFNDAAAFGDTNLELPSVRSSRSIVEVHMYIGSNVLTGNKDGLEINFEFPLHARYPPLGEHGFSRVEFGQPDLFTRCCIEGKPHNRSCIFLSTNKSAKSEAGAVVWDIPCGIKEHAGVVSFVTFASAIISALLLVFTSIYHSNGSELDELKQS